MYIKADVVNMTSYNRSSNDSSSNDSSSNDSRIINELQRKISILEKEYAVMKVYLKICAAALISFIIGIIVSLYNSFFYKQSLKNC